MDTKYNGWSNYETWVANLWMDNDEGMQNLAREWAQEDLDDAEGDKDEASRNLAARLEAMHDDGLADIAGVTGVFSDLLRHALGMVDWREIADAMLSDLE